MEGRPAGRPSPEIPPMLQIEPPVKKLTFRNFPLSDI